MERFTVAHNYRTQGRQLVAGTVVELDADDAAWVNQDSPGCLVPEGMPVADVEAEVDERAAGPVRDRQARPGRNRGVR